MKTHGNTLYATTQGMYLSLQGEAVVAKVDRSIKSRVPLHMLDGIVCFGRVSCSPYLLAHCGERGVGVSFLSERGRFLARVVGRVSGNVLLRLEQARAIDAPGARVNLARQFVVAKLLNTRAVLARFLRDHGAGGGPDDEGGHGDGEIRRVVQRLARLAQLVSHEQDLERLRGMEGEGAKLYFSVFDRLILRGKQSFAFARRSRRPPLDRINALLSFVYTLLAHDLASALQAVGLDPQIGYLHALRPGRPALALDVQEEFRAFLADRLALSLVNRQQLKAGHFEVQTAGAVHLAESGRRTVLKAWQQRKRETLRHPFLAVETTVGMLPHLQAQLLARHLRGDLDGYPPFLVR